MTTLLALVISTAILAASQAPSPLVPDPPYKCDDCAAWNEPKAPSKIFGNSYSVGTAGLSSILVTSPQGHILIDGALPQSAPLIDQNIRALGFKTTDVRIILNSHTHFDHAAGIAALQRHTGAQVLASPKSADALRRGSPNPEDPQYGFPASFRDFPAVQNVRELRDGETVRVGTAAVTAHFTPGHTPGGTTWTWRECEGQVCKNIVFGDSISPVAAPNYRFIDHPEVVETLRASIRRLGALPCNVLITTHPGAAQGKLCKAYSEAAMVNLDNRLATERKAVPAPAAASAPASPAGAGAGQRRQFDLTTPRPIDAIDSVWIEDLTWMEVRDAMKAGKTMAIVAAGSTEQNGPYVPAGKHVLVLRATAEAVARKLGTALIAPIVPFEPGNYSTTPGTIQVRPETFEAIIEDQAQSLKANGFAHVVLIGDSGGNQRGLANVAAKLTAAWAGSGTTIHYVKEYYDSWQAADAAWDSLGVPRTKDDGIHDDYSVNAIIASLDAGKVRFSQRVAAGKASINGQTLLPLEQTVANGRKLVDIRATITADAIRKALGTQ